MNNWSLNELYAGYDDKFLADIQTVKEKIVTLDTLSNQLNSLEDLETWLTLQQELAIIAEKLFAYVGLSLTTNITDSQSNKYEGVLADLMKDTVAPTTRFNEFLYKNKDNLASWVNESKLVEEHEFILQEIIDNFSHQLSDKEEELINILSINGTKNWSKLQDYITSNATIEFNGKPETLTSLRNMAYSADATLRKEAYEKEIDLYEQIEDAAAFALNSIKGEVNHLAKKRGYEDALEETLLKSRMSKETLDALWIAVDKYLPKFREYLKHKAKLLGHKNGLPWYDLFAPYEVSTSKTYTKEEARSFLIDNFNTFAPDLAGMTQDAFDNAWIDFDPKKGKVGGAFCHNLPSIKQSRILTNYDGSISSVITLAHELGHAYHGFLLQDNSILNTDYTMPVAETASTFCENIVLNAVLESADEDTQILLLENAIQDSTQIVVDILSRFLFESAVLEQRKENLLFAKDLKEIMLDAQDKTYGDGLDKDVKHPYMWVCKGHYYNGDNNFYNFPYAFGGLFALGLYAKFQEEGLAFVEKYRNLLRSTANKSCEDVALEVGVDITDPVFWEASLNQISQRIDKYIELSSK